MSAYFEGRCERCDKLCALRRGEERVCNQCLSEVSPHELLLAIGAHVERRLTFDQRRELFTIVARPRPGQTPELVEADTIVGVVRKARKAGIL